MFNPSGKDYEKIAADVRAQSFWLEETNRSVRSVLGYFASALSDFQDWKM